MRTAWTAVLRFARRWAPRVLRWVVVSSIIALGVMAVIGGVILRRQGDIPPLGPQVRAFGGLLMLLAAVFALWWLPKRQARAVGDAGSAAERAMLEDRARRTLAVVVGGALLLGMLGNGLRTLAQLRATADGEWFAQAVGMLSSEQLVTRVAGVHALDGLAASSETMRRPVYEALMVFVRERSRADSVAGVGPAADVTAAAAAVSRRAADGGGTPLRPDFSGAKLRGLAAPNANWDFARLRGAQLQGADLSGAHIAGKMGADLRGARLDSANLSAAHLDGARLDDASSLYHANLRGADLDGANLNGVDLRHARLDSAEVQGAGLRLARLDSASLRGALLDGATFTGASLVGTDFAGARMRNANLRGTDLRFARNLTAAQLQGARLDSTTALPPDVMRPAAPPSRP